MKGKPKFKEGDKVEFSFRDETKVGVVWIVDKWGTFDDTTDALTMWITIGRIDLRVYADFSESVVFYILDNWY